MTFQEQLFQAIKIKFPDAISKKINHDNFLDIHIPSINKNKGTHLFFNTAKNQIKIGFYCRDEEINTKILANHPIFLESYSQGVRLLSNPSYETVDLAVDAAFDFLEMLVSSNSTGILISDVEALQLRMDEI